MSFPDHPLHLGLFDAGRAEATAHTYKVMASDAAGNVSASWVSLTVATTRRPTPRHHRAGHPAGDGDGKDLDLARLGRG